MGLCVENEYNFFYDPTKSYNNQIMPETSTVEKKYSVLINIYSCRYFKIYY